MELDFELLDDDLFGHGLTAGRNQGDIRGPFENATSHLSNDAELGSSQRSGLKLLGSLKISPEL